MYDKVLFVVQDCFTIKGRGTVVTAQVGGDAARLITKGMDIVLRHPSGAEWQCTILDIKPSMDAKAPNVVGILLSLQAVKIPKGSKAFALTPPAAG